MPEHEVLYLLDAAGAVLWSDAGTPSALPDSRARWQAIWELRDRILEIAHSHPHGPCGFSSTDRTTMAAIDAALGRHVRYVVVAPDGVVAAQGAAQEKVDPEPAWAMQLREESGMRRRMP